jgi:hypothetical protein
VFIAKLAINTVAKTLFEIPLDRYRKAARHSLGAFSFIDALLTEAI